MQEKIQSAYFAQNAEYTGGAMKQRAGLDLQMVKLGEKLQGKLHNYLATC